MKQIKTALITGATAGIGQATAQILAENGLRLILTGRRAERLMSLAQKLREEYQTDVKTLAFDVRNRSKTASALDSLPEAWKKIDVLINNAGLAMGRGPVQEDEIENWEIMIDTNVKGLLYVSRHITPWMIHNGTGQVINLSSIAGLEVYPEGGVYCATKFAVTALSKAMRIDMVKHGIKVTNICPGMVDTEFSLVRFKGDVEKAAQVYAGVEPLVARDIAEAVWFAINRPAHVNIDEIVLTCTAQAFSRVVVRD